MLTKIAGFFFLIALFPLSSLSQTTVDGRTQEAAALNGSSLKIIETLNLGDSPISIERRTGWANCCHGWQIGGVQPEDPDKVGFALRNISDKSVLAYALVVTTAERKEVEWYMKMIEPVRPNTDFIQMYMLSGKESAVWKVDWVLFDDGTTWGPDEYGVSKAVYSYRKGRQTAIDRAQELLGYADTNPIMWFKHDGSFTTAVSVFPRQARYETEKDYFKMGYKFIVESLEFDAKNSNREVSRLVAARLKELEAADVKP